jgi:acetylornithine deacetylase
VTAAHELDPIDLLEQLVRIDSVNASMGGRGERAMVEAVARILDGIGCEVQIHDIPSADRPNVVATLPGRDTGRVLLLEAHMDTVALPREPHPVRSADGRLYARGACDTKGSAAAMLAALSRLAGSDDRPTVVFAGVSDEEAAMTGSRALLDQLPAVDAAIVGEPTSLRPVRAHNGMLRFRIIARGAAAHTSRAHLGVNAIAAAARVVLTIQDELLPELQQRSHPLAGPALITAAMIDGGVAPNLVPAWCAIHVDRRLAPGEDPARALGEVDALLEAARARGDDVSREEPSIVLPAVEIPADDQLVVDAEAVVSAELGMAVSAGGVPYGTDASNLSGVGGISCVVLGPGSIDQAHTDEEWVDLAEVERASRIYESIVRRYAEGEPTASSPGE